MLKDKQSFIDIFIAIRSSKCCPKLQIWSQVYRLWKEEGDRKPEKNWRETWDMGVGARKRSLKNRVSLFLSFLRLGPMTVSWVLAVLFDFGDTNFLPSSLPFFIQKTCQGNQGTGMFCRAELAASRRGWRGKLLKVLQRGLVGTGRDWRPSSVQDNALCHSRLWLVKFTRSHYCTTKYNPCHC